MFDVTIRGDGLPVYREIDTSNGNQWHIPEEVPVAFVYNRRNYAVMMATPDDFVDFAVGFTLTEEIVKTADDILSLDINLSDKGADLRFKISNQSIEKLDVTSDVVIWWEARVAAFAALKMRIACLKFYRAF